MSERFRRATRLLLLAAAVGVGCARSGQRLGDTLTVATPYEVFTLDPHAKNTLSNFAVVSHFYEPLVTTDAEMRIRPWLARLWETPDPRTWVFHLRGGVRFASGRPLQAEDAAFSIRRLQQTPGLEMASYAHYITEAVATSPLTLRIRTDRPLSILLNKLRFVGIVPAGSETRALARNPDGTGPFELGEWSAEAVRMRRRDDYWGEPPAFREVVFLLDREPEQAASDLLQGRAQLAQCNSRAAEARVARDPRFRRERRPSLFIKYLGFDVARERTPFARTARNPFRDPRVRQAIGLAIDRRRLVDGLPQDAVPAHQLVPPSIFGFDPGLPEPAHDPGRARALLAEAGYPAGFEVTLHARKLFAEAAHSVRDQLREVGVRAELVVLGDQDFLDAARARELSLHLSRFGCPTGDASDVLETALHTTDPARQAGGNNYFGYSNPEADRMIEESAGIEGLRDRREALMRVMRVVMRDLPWIPLYVDQDVYVLDARLRWQPRNDSFILAAEIRPARSRGRPDHPRE